MNEVPLQGPFTEKYVGSNDHSIKNKNNTVKILSYNVRLFNAYKWIKKNDTKEQILNFINKENPDLLCIQEFYSKDSLPKINLSYLNLGTENKKNERTK